MAFAFPTPQQFEEVIRNVLSPNNEDRGRAEEIFNQCVLSNGDATIQMLVQLLRASQAIEIRQLSAVLLRKTLMKQLEEISEQKDENQVKNIIKDAIEIVDDLKDETPPVTVWSLLSAETKTIVKREMLLAMEAETSNIVRHKITYAIAGFSSALIETGEFPELLPAMFQWAQSTSVGHKESALSIFNQLATFLMEEGLTPFLPQLKAVLHACINDSNLKIRIAALQSIISVVNVLEEAKNKDPFRELIGPMLNVVASCLNEKKEEDAVECVESLIELADIRPRFFKTVINDVVNSMYAIAGSQQVEESVRHLAVEFLLTLCDQAAPMMRKVPQLADRLFPLCMHMMLEVEESDEWNNSKDDDEDTDLTNYDVGIDALDRIASTLGAKLVLSVAFSLIPNFMSNGDWRYRHVGLMAIAQIADGCKKQFSMDILKGIMPQIMNLFNDQYPRVRYAAVHCIAQLSVDFAHDFQKTFHTQVLPGFIQRLDDPIPRVQSHAAASIVNFVEDCPHEYVEPYMDAVLGRLLNLLQNGKRFVQEQTLCTIAAVADCAKQGFIKYYDAFMPFMKLILNNALGKQDRDLRAKAMEAVSLIGIAVGKEKFGPDAIEIMNILMKTQVSQLDSDDPQVYYMLQAWSRIAKALGQDFLPYLAYVMPPILQSAQLKPEVQVTDADEDIDEEGMESVVLTIKGVGEKRLSIRTSLLEEKSMACDMIYSYALDLKEGFYPYVETVAKIMVPLLKFPYMDEIRETAGATMPELINVVKAYAQKNGAGPELVKQLMDYIFETLLLALKIETEVKTATILLEALHQCINAAGPGILSEEQLGKSSEVLKIVLDKCIERRKNIYKYLVTEEDEDEMDNLNHESDAEEAELLQICEALGTLLKTHKSFVTHFMNRIWESLVNIINDTNCSPEDYRIAVCILDDFVENVPQAALNDSVLQFITITLLKFCNHKNSDLRQAAVYGVGALAQFAPEVFGQAIPECVKQLTAAISRPDAREEDEAAATANAVSALYKIVQFRPQFADCTQAMNVWLRALPVSGDILEARIVHGHLINLVASNNAVVLGQNNQNIPAIIKIFAQISLDSEVTTKESKEQMVALLRQMKASLSPEILQASWGAMTNEERAELQKLLA